jgi:hypothetical protein
MRGLKFIPILFAIFLGTFSVFTNTYAAQRIVSYAGLTGLELQTTRLANLNNNAFCTLMIVNTGGTRQTLVSIQTLTTTLGAGSVLTTTAAGALFNTCTPSADLIPGASCYVNYAVPTFLGSERYGLCAGTITVQDFDPSLPGSVVATGNITVQQEAMVMGGVLSGAQYVSGQVTNISGNRNGSMNLFCTAACMSTSGAAMGGANQRACEALCGVDASTAPYYPPSPRTISGLIDQNAVADPSIAPTGSTPTSILAYAPSYFAGGTVYELEMGALDSICNGNPQYISDGYSPLPGAGFDHSLGSAQSADAEVLFCGHRHSLPDLYMKVGQAIPIVINGGSSF